MSKRNAKNKLKLAVLNEINQIDRRLKRSKIKNNEEETSKLMSKRNTLRNDLVNFIERIELHSDEEVVGIVYDGSFNLEILTKKK